jgi:carbamoyl-phosphate synthase small subunit
LFDDFIEMIRQFKIDNPQLPRQAQLSAASKLAANHAEATATAAKGELHYAKK